MPTPIIRWFRIEGIHLTTTRMECVDFYIEYFSKGENSIAVHSSSKIGLLADGSIRFSRMAKVDEGLFQCRASNNIGNALFKTIRINVNGNIENSSKFYSIYLIYNLFIQRLPKCGFTQLEPFSQLDRKLCSVVKLPVILR